MRNYYTTREIRLLHMEDINTRRVMNAVARKRPHNNFIQENHITWGYVAEPDYSHERKLK